MITNYFSTHLGLGNIDGGFTVVVTISLWWRDNKASNKHHHKEHGESTYRKGLGR